MLRASRKMATVSHRDIRLAKPSKALTERERRSNVPIVSEAMHLAIDLYHLLMGELSIDGHSGTGVALRIDFGIGQWIATLIGLTAQDRGRLTWNCNGKISELGAKAARETY